MAIVALLRGVNVGGHRRFRPATLARELAHLDAVNIGAAGTFVIRRAVTRSQLRAELARRLPFETEIMICDGGEVAALVHHDHLAAKPEEPGVVRFVSILARRPRVMPQMPMTFPAAGPWLLKILGSDGRFVFGAYRRHMKTIGYLGKIDQLFGVPVTTRNQNTIAAIARVLADDREPR